MGRHASGGIDKQMKQWLACGPLGEVAEVTPRGEEELSDIGAEPANEREEE
jgi:hypothetical protein